MARIGKTFPHPEITQNINRIKMLWYQRIWDEIEKSIIRTMMRGWALFHISREARETLLELIEKDDRFIKNR